MFLPTLPYHQSMTQFSLDSTFIGKPHIPIRILNFKVTLQQI